MRLRAHYGAYLAIDGQSGRQFVPNRPSRYLDSGTTIGIGTRLAVNGGSDRGD
jgi:hypothetical protein